MLSCYWRHSEGCRSLRFGKHRGWHDYPDQGSFVLSAYGDTFVIDRALGAP